MGSRQVSINCCGYVFLGLGRVNSSPPGAAYMRQWMGQHASRNGLSPIRRQAIIWTSAWLLSIEPLGILNSNQNTKFFIRENTSENIFCKMEAILSRRRWVNLCLFWLLCDLNTGRHVRGHFRKPLVPATEYVIQYLLDRLSNHRIRLSSCGRKSIYVSHGTVP